MQKNDNTVLKVFLLSYVLKCVWNDIHFGNYLIYNIGFVDRHLSQSSSVLFTLVFEDFIPQLGFSDVLAPVRLMVMIQMRSNKSLEKACKHQQCI